MLFNSLVFLLVFLPAVVVGDALVRRVVPRARLAYLVFVSLFFYGTFDIRFVPLLCASVLLNWLVAGQYRRTTRAVLVTAAIAINLALLGLFKYLDFLADLASTVPGLAVPHVDLAFPLGISFFTFQHIAYLVDLKRGKTEHTDLLRYGLYVAFFPKVIAGPLVRPREFLPQIDDPGLRRPESAETLARGLLLLTAGLAKKVFIGDPLGEYVDPVYALVAAGGAPSVGQAWDATLGYTFQLYFDFSGYSDMAIGIALLFGIALPQNFDAPYRSVSIQDFWRRWHITLSTFLRDYLYIAFGGNRHGMPRQLLALFATMALGGLWHGAGLTFVAWGAAHGIALGFDLVWRKRGLTMPDGLGFALTFAFVALAWVLFRAPDFGTALAIYRALLGGGPLGHSEAWPMLALAVTFAMLGPTAWTLVRRLPPARWVGVAAAVLALAVLLKVGNDTSAEFIYAQF
ncbi:MBOAT family O-acyltransferase [uncultured Enterovirga sp.]|uniref:MBOAT family O-acyltransferase n=1 Tax=uncultured Enterovirga sp. TaxID=2026352 RepID=UPI0035CC549A